MTTRDLEIVLAPTAAEIATVDRGLDVYNLARVGHEGRLLAAVRASEDGGFDAGWTMQLVGPRAILVGLWVAPDQRGAGLGTRLLRAAEAAAWTEGARTLIAGVHGEAQVRFLRRNGYGIAAHVPALTRGHDLTYLRRDLEPGESPLVLRPAAGSESAELRRRTAAAHEATRDRADRPLAAVLRDGDTARGGVLARLDRDDLYVDVLWVDDALRGRGLGARLMAAIETEAAQHGARTATLDTFDFQAPGFYRRLGYVPLAEVPDFLPGATRHFFRKELGRAA